MFDSKEAAYAAIAGGAVERGNVVVIRNEGPRSGPATRDPPDHRRPVGAGRADDVALVTDGRFSGAIHGFVVGHICPETSDSGPIAHVLDGDCIRIDVAARRINVLADLTGRTPPLRPARNLIGVTRKYAASVTSASDGAITSGGTAWRLT